MSKKINNLSIGDINILINDLNIHNNSDSKYTSIQFLTLQDIEFNDKFINTVLDISLNNKILYHNFIIKEWYSNKKLNIIIGGIINDYS